jgi:hypothetical protein
MTIGYVIKKKFGPKSDFLFDFSKHKMYPIFKPKTPILKQDYRKNTDPMVIILIYSNNSNY